MPGTPTGPVSLSRASSPGVHQMEQQLPQEVLANTTTSTVGVDEGSEESEFDTDPDDSILRPPGRVRRRKKRRTHGKKR